MTTISRTCSRWSICNDYFFVAFLFADCAAVRAIRAAWAFFSAFFLLRDSEIFFLCSSESLLHLTVFWPFFFSNDIQHLLILMSSSSLIHHRAWLLSSSWVLRLCSSMLFANCSSSSWRWSNIVGRVSLNARINAQNTRASPAIMNHSASENHGILLMCMSAMRYTIKRVIRAVKLYLIKVGRKVWLFICGKMKK